MEMTQIEGPIIGIDLGTFYSCVAVSQNGKVEIIPDDKGNRITPSGVAFTTKEQLVGYAAQNLAAYNPINTIYDVKRLIGRQLGDKSVQDVINCCPFKVAAGNGDKPMIIVQHKGQEKRFEPEEIAAIVLNKMKEIAENYLKCAVSNIVVTVPAYFNDSQRQATRDAGKIAGLNIVRIINEPMAAALAYGLDLKKGSSLKVRTVLIFDLGGGSCDVSLLEIEDGIIEVKAISGDTCLGGQDLDNRMVSHLAKEFFGKHNKDITKNTRALRKLVIACERAKHILSTANSAVIEIGCLYEGIDFHVNITRSEFGVLNMEFFSECMKLVEQCLKDAEVEREAITDVVLVGWLTRIPVMQNLLKNMFEGNSFLYNTIRPDEVVAYGAAIQAARLSVQEQKHEVVPLSLGLVVGQDRYMTTMITKGTPIPAKATKIILIQKDYHTSCSLPIVQGERSKGSDNIFLGEFQITGIKPSPAFVQEILVTFNIDSSSTLHVTAENDTCKRKATLTISNVISRYTTSRISRIIREADIYKLEDEEWKREAVARNDVIKGAYRIRNKINERQVASKLGKERFKYKKVVVKIIKWCKDSGLRAKIDELEDKMVILESIKTAVEARISTQANGKHASVLMQLFHVLARLF